MAKVRSSQSGIRPATRRTPIDPEMLEGRCVSKAFSLAEQRMDDGTASSQEVVYFLKLGSQKYQKEIEKLEEENKHLRAKVKSLENGDHYNVLVEEAIKAMRTYTGNGSPEDYEEYDDYYDDGY